MAIPSFLRITSRRGKYTVKYHIEKVQFTVHVQLVLTQPGFTPDTSNQQLGDASKTLVLAEAHFMPQQQESSLVS